ncbi:MAG TPA: universal stress protein [Acidobacteriota bacterium]|nr:universal stress protein [Acidobacteriota bacterium]
MFQRIVLATDFSESSRGALRAAISLAKSCLAQIEAVHVDVTRFPTFSSHGSEWLAELKTRFDSFFPSELYPRSRKEILVGHSVTHELLNFVRSREADLIVLGCHGHSAVEHLLLGSVTQEVTRSSEVPVLVVHRFAGEESHFDRVLVPTDFSEAAMRALEYGARFANFLKADLHYIHVADLPALEEVHAKYLAHKIQMPETCELNVDAVLKKTLEPVQVEGTVVVATLSGEPVREILQYSKAQQIDWVVMGTHGRKGLERILLGSVTSGVIAHSEVPVMTISHHS